MEGSEPDEQIYATFGMRSGGVAAHGQYDHSEAVCV